MDCRANKGLSEFCNVRDLGPPMFHCQDRSQATENTPNYDRPLFVNERRLFVTFPCMLLVAAFRAYLMLCINVLRNYTCF
jgi:hypothetical protein